MTFCSFFNQITALLIEIVLFSHYAADRKLNKNKKKMVTFY
jgi:hypothetical protein